MTEATIRLVDVTKSFGQKQILYRISATVKRGTVVGLLARNGQGKTTLFKILADLLQADRGEISVLGVSADGSGAIRKKVGYIPEHPSFHNFMTVRQVLQLRSGFYRNWDWTKVYKLCANIDLDLNSKMLQASKGTLCKTAWVCASAHNPEILLLDEPTSGLDPVSRDSVLHSLVGELTHQDMTVVVANHHMEELIGILDEVWVLSEGTFKHRLSMEEFRRSSFRITGRLRKPLQSLPVGVYEEGRDGDWVRWFTFNSEIVPVVQKSNALERMQCEPLPIKDAIKSLLLTFGAENE